MITPMSGTRSTPMIEMIPRRQWRQLAVAYVGLGAVAWWWSSRAPVDAWWPHGLWCAVGLLCALPTLATVRRGFSVVLTDHRLVFLAAFALYFLFGAALLSVGPEAQVLSSLSLYPIGPRDALRVDAVNGLGFGLALGVSALSRGRWLGAQATSLATHVSRLSSVRVIGTFLVAGSAATLYLLPFDIGLRDGATSGLVRTIGQLSLVAILLAVSVRGKYERALRFFGFGLALLLMFVGALRLMKSEILLPVAALTAGLALRFGTRRVLPVGLAVLVAGYMLLGNVVNYGRSAAFYSTGTSFTERWEYLLRGWEESRNLPENQEYGYWSRLCYVPTQAASLDFFDEGQGGNGMTLLPWVFVPRFLAPEKPQMTLMFAELNAKITGSDLSSTAPGVFASGYYHGGWWGLLLASVVCGWIVAQTSAIARVVYAQRAALMTPLSLLGMFIAFRIDGDFIPDYLGNFIFILYPLVGAALVSLLAGGSKVRHHEAPGAVR